MEDSRLALNDAHGFIRLLLNNLVEFRLADGRTRLFVSLARRLDLLRSMSAAEHEDLALRLLGGDVLGGEEVGGAEEDEETDEDAEVAPEVTVEVLVRLVDVGAS